MIAFPGRRTYVVDDDAEDRLLLESLLRARSMAVRGFDGSYAFLDVLEELDPGLVFLDARMPGLGGLEVIDALRARHLDWPIIMVSGQADIPLAVQAMRKGASDFIEKPCTAQPLDEALIRSVNHRASVKPVRQSRGELLKKVTPRELQILELLVEGHANKSIAFALNISEKTVEVHRAKVMKRLNARSFAELIRHAVSAGIGERAA